MSDTPLPPEPKQAHPSEAPPVEIPMSRLSEDVLRRVIEQFILREGTDYGAVEVPLEAKIEQVRRQLERRDARIYFDPNTETITILRAEECPRANSLDQ